jgi:hypothetical protein
MADNEIKILKSNTFEEWRQKSNEVSLNLGADDRLDSRLTDKVFKHDNVSGLKLNIIDGDDDNTKTQVFPLITDTTIDNTAGYVILADSTSIPSAFIAGAGVGQTGGYSATIESIVTIDDKPKILVKNSTGDFNPALDLSVGGSSIANANVLRLISESYNKAAIRVLDGSTELTQGLAAADYHIPNATGRVVLTGSPDLTKFTEGSTVYQDSANRSTLTEVEDNASWHGTVYHAGTSDLYIKSHTGTYSASAQIRILGYTAAQAKVAGAQHTAFIPFDQTVGHIVEFNSTLSVNDDIKVIATDLVTAINELQDDIGTVENLNTTATDLQAAINEHEADLFNVEGGSKRTLANLKTADKTSILDSINEIYDDIHTAGSVTLGTNANYLVGGVNELETAVRGNLSNYTLGTTNTSDGVIGAVNELEAALRGANSDYNVTAGNNIRDGLNAVYADIHTAGSVTLNTSANYLVGGINELEVALRGTTLANYTLTTSSVNGVIGGINEHDAELGTITSAAMGTDASTVSTAILELETALRGTTNNYVTWGAGANIAATDVRGAIVELGTTIGSGVITGTDTEAVGAANLTVAVNLLNTAIGDSDIYNTGTYGSTTIAGTLDNLKTGVVNNDTDIGKLQNQIDGATSPIDNVRSWTGLAATNISEAIQEIADTDIIAGAGLTGGGILQADRTLRVVGATNGGITVLADSIKVDNTVIRTITTNGTTGTQTFNQNIAFTTGNTLTIPDGATLDIDGTLLIGGGAGSSLSFDTAFITLASSAGTEGIEVDRSAIDIGSGVGGATSPTLDAKIQWNEGNVSTKPDRAWQAVGIDDSGNALTADIVTFYNAQDLISNNTETDLNATWDSTNQNFDFALKTTGVTAQEYGSTTAIPVITVDSKGRITAADTAAIVTELTFSAETNSGGTGHQKINLATETLHFDGVANQIVTEAKDDEVEFGLPNDLRAPGTLRVLSTTQSTSTTSGSLRVAGGVGIAKDVYIGGNLTVSGTTTQVNSNQVNIGDNIIVLNADETGTPTQNAGFEIERGSVANRSLIWNETSDTWQAQASNGSYYDIITEQTDYDNWKLAAEGIAGTEDITSTETVTFNQAAGLTVTRSGSTIEYGHADTSSLSGQQGTASGGNVVQAFTVDGFGHVTSVDVANLDNRFIRSWNAKDHDGTVYSITQNDTLWFKEGTGMDVNFTADDVLTFTNTDRGSSQNIFKNVQLRNAAHGSLGTLVADSNNDTLIIDAGNSGITLVVDDVSGDRFSIHHANTSDFGNINNSGNTFIQDLTFDEFGHVTGGTSASISVGNGTLTLFAGNAMGLSIAADNNIGSFTANQSGNTNITIDHADTSTQLSSDNTGNVVIQDIALDTYGHITSLGTKDIQTVTNANNVNVDEKNDNVNYQILFSATNGSGYQRPYIDTDNSHLRYNPSTTLLSGINIDWSDVINEPTFDNYSSWTFMEGNGSETGTVSSGQTLHFEQGSGIEVEKTADRQLTITNNDRGSSQPTIDRIKVVSSDSGYAWSDTGTVNITGNKTEVDFVESTGIDIDIDDTNKAVKFRNTAPHVGTNLSWTRTASVLTVTSSTGNNVDLPSADANGPGVMTVGAHNKLTGIENSAEVNQNAFSTFELGTYSSTGGGGTDMTAASKTDEMSLMFWLDSFDTSVNNISNLGTVRLKSDQTDNIYSVGRTGSGYLSFHTGNTGYGDFKSGGVTEFRMTSSGTFEAAGDIIAYSSNITSDEKLKDNIQVVDGALEKVSQLNGVTFDWKKDGKASAGVIAQNVEEVLPSAVKDVESLNEDDTHKVVDYNQLSALFIEAIKELKEENKLLRAEIEALKDINR